MSSRGILQTIDLTLRVTSLGGSDLDRWTYGREIRAGGWQITQNVS